MSVNTILAITGLLAVFAAAALSRRRVSPWWIFLPASGSAAVAAYLFSPVSTCHERDAVEYTFAIAILAGLGLYTTSALTALFDAVRLARSGAAGRAAARLVPFVLSAALAVGTFFLWIGAVLSCIE
jgi:hypothetical protein